MSWESEWAEGKTGWDAGKAAPALTELADSKSLRGSTALVPGCGSGYDVFQLSEAGFAATGLDVAPTAAKRFRALRTELGLTEEQAKIETGDFFSHQPPTGGYDVIYDYTFLCAIDLDQREAWANKMAELLAPDGELITLIFPIEVISESGAPYQVKPGDVEALLDGRFKKDYLAPVNRSHAGREGLEWLGRWKLVE